jgi:hypothetical protein
VCAWVVSGLPGTIGHVAHGKSTVVKAISGVQTVRFKTELVRNITIKLGYANAKIFKCDNPKCYRPGNYKAMSSATIDRPSCEKCYFSMTLQRHVSFVDCPGHDILMATMLNGAAVMDAALLLIAGNETCPQPQTSGSLVLQSFLLAFLSEPALRAVLCLPGGDFFISGGPLRGLLDKVISQTRSLHRGQIRSTIPGMCSKNYSRPLLGA